MSVKRFIFLAYIATSIAFASECTQTQCALTYTAPDAGPCYLTGTDNSGFVPSINDLNPTLFAGANIDLERTVANGFKWPTIQSGNQRTVFIGSGPGGSSKKALDNNWYTVPLQVATPHTFTVSCAGGSVVGTIDTTTANIPLGNYYPEPPPLDTTAPLGQVAIPTFKWDRSTPYIADNGILHRQLTIPMDFPTELHHQQAFSNAFDPNGAWTNPNNALTVQAAGTLAVTSTVGAPLVLAWSSPTGPMPNAIAWDASVNGYPTDVQVALYGHGSGTLALCITTDWQTCATNEVAVDLTGSDVVMNTPGGYPQSHFASWGGFLKHLGARDLISARFTPVTASGRVVTLPSLSGQQSSSSAYVNLTRKAGAKFKLSSCSGGTGNGIYTYASIDSYFQITAVETIGTASGCTFNDLSSGIIIKLVSAGTANISATFNAMGVNPPQQSSSPNHDICNFNKVTIATDCDGVAQSPTTSGYLCQIGNWGSSRAGIYLIQDNGRMCLQSVLYLHGSGSGYATTVTSAWDQTSPTKIGLSIGGNLWTATKNTTTNFTEYKPGTSTPVNDDWTYTQVVPSKPIVDSNPANPSQLKDMCGPGGTNVANCSEIWRHFETGLWGAEGIAGHVQFASISGGYTNFIAGPMTALGESYFLKFRGDLNGNLVQAHSSFDKYPYRFVRQHSFPQGVGPWLLMGSAGGISFDSGITGPHVLQITSIHKPSGFQSYTIPGTITCTNASLVVCSTASQHRLDQLIVTNGGRGRGRGSMVTISGATAGWSSMNGLKMAVPIGNDNATIGSNATDFNLYDPYTGAAVNSTGFGSYPGGITFTTTPPIPNWSIGGLTNTCPATVTVSPGKEDSREPQTADSLFADGDPVGISNFPTTQFYWHRTGALTGDLYFDAALTQPVDNAIAAGQCPGGTGTGGSQYTTAYGKGIYFAEPCPAGLPAIPFDPSYPASPTGIRCVKIRVTGEPCSYLASTAEHNAYPCSLDTANTALSQLQSMIVGDAIGDFGRQDFSENLHIAQKSLPDLTLVRFAASLISPDIANLKPLQNNHEVGWLPYMLPTFSVDHQPSAVMVDATDPTATPYPVTPVTGDHTDLGYCPGGLYTYSGANGTGNTQQEDPTYCVTIAGFQAVLPTTKLHKYPVWAGYQTPLQHVGYTGGPRHLTGSWVGDETTINSLAGGLNGSGLALYSVTLTLQSGTAHVYKISPPAADTFMPKHLPMQYATGPNILIDKSGPSSLLTDSDIGRGCTAYLAGECRPGSSVGDRFMALSADITGDVSAPFWCSTGTMNTQTACIYQLAGLDAMLVQERVVQFDRPGHYFRALTRNFLAPGWPYSYHSWFATPDAKWGFAPNVAMNGEGQGFITFRIPQYIAPDSVNRTNYVPVQIQIGSGRTGDQIRVQFGYAEDSPDVNTSLYCRSRAEACYTSSGATDSNPFQFANETQSRTACATGCSISIPAISRRVLYYRVLRYNAGGEVSGPLQWKVVP